MIITYKKPYEFNFFCFTKEEKKIIEITTTLNLIIAGFKETEIKKILKH